MKKILALMLALCMVFALVACGTPDTPDTPDTPNTPNTPDTPDTPDEPEVTPYDSLAVLLEMFGKADAKLFEGITFLNAESALAHLNIGFDLGRGTPQVTNFNGFVDGVFTQPGMMLATQAVSVMQFESDKDLDAYLESLKGMQHMQVCVSPDPEKVHVAKNGNFICYVSAQMFNEDGSFATDYGPALIDAFKAIDFEKGTQGIAPAGFDAVLKALEGAAEYDLYRIDDMTMNAIYFIDEPQYDEEYNELPGKHGLAAADIKSFINIYTEPDYTAEGPTYSAYSCFIIEMADAAKAETVKGIIENGFKDSTNYFFASETAKTSVTVEGTTVTATIIK